MQLLNSPNVRAIAIVTLCAASVVFSKLALPAGFLVLVVWLSLPKLENSGQRRRINLTLLGAAILACVAFLRFVLDEAIPGVIAGGRAAATKHAIAFARSIVVAQDHARQNPLFDPDSDGIGSAVPFTILAGMASADSSAPMPDTPTPLFLRRDQLVDSADGQLVREGAYLFKLCLPVVGGGFAAAGTGAQFDAEAAERHYLLFAWPHSFGAGGPKESLFLDEHERILTLGADANGNPRYQGTTQTPPCSDALDGDWVQWKDKQARKDLPGDSS